VQEQGGPAWAPAGLANCITIDRPSLLFEPLVDSWTALTKPACCSVVMALVACFLVSDPPSSCPRRGRGVGRPPTVYPGISLDLSRYCESDDAEAAPADARADDRRHEHTEHQRGTGDGEVSPCHSPSPPRSASSRALGQLALGQLDVTAHLRPRAVDRATPPRAGRVEDPHVVLLGVGPHASSSMIMQ